MNCSEEITIGSERFIHNLVASGVKLEELPIIFNYMYKYAEKLERPEYDQTS